MDEDDYYLNPEDEYEMMHADELELLNEMEYDDHPVPAQAAPPASVPSAPAAPAPSCPSLLTPPAPVRRSLDFCSGKTSASTSLPEDNSVKSSSICHSESQVLSRKRTVDDLFGDIDDIELEEALGDPFSGLAVKRSCSTLKKVPNFFTDEELDLDKNYDKEALLIDRINARRKTAFLHSHEGRSSTSPASVKFKESTNMTKGVPKWPFVSVTSHLGHRVYVRVRTEEYVAEEYGKVSHKGGSFGLLRRGFSSLKADALKVLEERQKSIIAAQKAEVAALLAPEDVSTSDTDSLWVVKYRPTGYAELLSEESVNRTLLHWLRLWDKVVFNKDRKIRIKPQEDKKETRFQKKPFGQVMTDELDEFGRPQFKMVLLCGPPGLGKTTLAHMVAKLAGYNVVEVNASDDRSPDAFYTQLEAATQMRAVLGEDPKPNCLVLDEIDGAPSASIETLIKFVLGKDVGKARAKKKGAGSKILKRPVICICNDAYVPALRTLRQNAFVIHFPPTASERLASRLMHIARKQNLKTDMSAMLALCEKTQNDIRSCLSLLHYFKSQNRPVRLSDVLQSSIGMKDIQKGLFSVWQEIFQIQTNKRAFNDSSNDSLCPGSMKSNIPEAKSVDSSISSRVQKVLRTVQSHGDYNRLILGVFENYPNMKVKDSSLNGLSKGLDWFCTTDILNTEIQTSQNYILMPYMAYAFPAWHLIYAGFSWPKINYPSSSYEASVKEGHTKQIVAEMVKGMSPFVRGNANETQLIIEILPLLLDILAPNFRPVSLQLFNSNEKKELCNLVSVMIDYNLTYTQERTPEGNYVCSLDPNIEEVVHFGGSKQQRTLNYTIKQLVAREIELEKMRRLELLSGRALERETTDSNDTSRKGQPVSSVNSEQEKSAKTISPPSVPNHLRKLKAKPILQELETRDFFGRVVEVPVSPSTAKAKTEAALKGDIWYHFKEGFNNAVRRTIRISDLL